MIFVGVVRPTGNFVGVDLYSGRALVGELVFNFRAVVDVVLNTVGREKREDTVGREAREDTVEREVREVVLRGAEAATAKVAAEEEGTVATAAVVAVVLVGVGAAATWLLSVLVVGGGLMVPTLELESRAVGTGKLVGDCLEECLTMSEGSRCHEAG